MKRLKIIAFIYIAFWSTIIGLLTGCYLQLINIGIDFVWKTIPQILGLSQRFLPLILCIPLGLLVGIAQWKIGNYPLTIAEVFGELKTTGSYNYRQWWRTLVCGLLVLSAGGSVGPEASATGLVTGMIYWLGCRYKMTMANKQLAAQPFSSQLKTIILAHTADYQTQIHSQPITAYFKTPQIKKIHYLVWTLFGLAGLVIVFSFFPQEGVIGIHLQTIHWQFQELLVVIPALAIGIIFGWLFVQFGIISEKWIGRSKHLVVNGIIGGLILGVLALWNSNILYSGEFNIQSFAKSSLTMSPLFLVSFAFAKAFVTNVGFSLGWRGGTIFPAIFSSLAIGAATASFLSGMPQLTACIVVAAAVTIILERPLLTTILLCLLFPIQFAPLILVIAYLAKWALAVANRIVKKF